MNDPGTATLDVARENLTLSTVLKKWLRGQTHNFFSRGEKLRSNVELWAEVDRLTVPIVAARVMRGFRLLQIREASERDFVEGLKKRGIAHASAYREMDLCALFLSCPDLENLHRAAELGAARIRELKPLLGLDGVRALIAGTRVEGLDYDRAANMTKRSIIEWRNKKRAAKNQQRLAHAKTRGIWSEAEPSPEEPQAAALFREEGLAVACRLRAEMALMQHAFASLPKQQDNDAHEPWFRAAVSQIDAELRGLLQDAQTVHAVFVERYGVGILDPDAVSRQKTAQVNALRANWIAEVHEAAKERLRERHQRYRLRGRPAVNGVQPTQPKGKRGRPRKQ